MTTEVLRVTERADVAAELARAGEVLRRGGLVAFPTETVYGIAAAADLPQAVARLYAVKERPRDKPMTVMVADAADVRRRCPTLPPAAARLVERFWPGPLTLVLRDAAGHATGFRLPSHPLALGLVRAAGVPLLVPSANRASQPPAVTAEQVLAAFPTEIDLVIDGGPAQGGVASTVVQVLDAGVEVLREGAIPAARILDAGTTIVLFVCTGNTDRSPLAAACLRRRLSQRFACSEAELERRGLRVESAGVSAVEGRRPSLLASQIARQWPGGPLDVSAHRSCRLTQEMVDRATHVYCMEQSHVDQILAFFPGRERDVHRVDPEEDVADPAGRSTAAYRRVAQRLDEAATRIAGGLVPCASSS